MTFAYLRRHSFEEGQKPDLEAKGLLSGFSPFGLFYEQSLRFYQAGNQGITNPPRPGKIYEASQLVEIINALRRDPDEVSEDKWVRSKLSPPHNWTPFFEENYAHGKVITFHENHPADTNRIISTRYDFFRVFLRNDFAQDLSKQCTDLFPVMQLMHPELLEPTGNGVLYLRGVNRKSYSNGNGAKTSTTPSVRKKK